MIMPEECHECINKTNETHRRHLDWARKEVLDEVEKIVKEIRVHTGFDRIDACDGLLEKIKSLRNHSSQESSVKNSTYCPANSLRGSEDKHDI